MTLRRIAVLTIATAVLYAGTHVRGAFADSGDRQIGVLIGAAHSYLKAGQDIPDLKSKYAPQFLAFLEVESTDGLSMRFGLGFSQYAFEEPIGDNSGAVARTQLDYLTLPFLLVLRDPGPEDRGVYVLLGPRVDVFLNRGGGHFDTDAPADSLSRIPDDFSGAVLGGTAGIGLTPGGSTGVQYLLEFRYEMDFTDVSNRPSVDFKKSALIGCIGILF